MEILDHSVCASSIVFNNVNFNFFLMDVLILSQHCLSVPVAPYSDEQQHHLAFNFWECRRHEMPFHLVLIRISLITHESEYHIMLTGQMSSFFYEVHIQFLSPFFYLFVCLYFTVAELCMCWILIPTLFMVSIGGKKVLILM